MEKEKWYNKLKPYAILLSGVNADLENMIDDELVEILEACKHPTKTNCWCWVYQSAKWVQPLVEAELARRKYET